ncbi:MAG: bacteriorhodopsin [Actinomycetota bacterium]|nr:bacteriorhodopsin [Actinomycetota bacterium]
MELGVILSQNQFNIVYNVLSFGIAAMLAGFIGFILLRDQLKAKHRAALTLGTLVMAIADYHYFRIFESWVSAYHIKGGHYVATGIPFNEAYRYVDWLLTVPLLLAELIAVLELGKERSKGLIGKLIVASSLMIATGYPGQIAGLHSTSRTVWAAISSVFFFYILYVLVVEINKVMKSETEEVKKLMFTTRALLIMSWGFYPIAYILPSLFSGATVIVVTQVGYTVADVIAKPLWTYFIFKISKAKQDDEELSVVSEKTLKVA